MDVSASESVLSFVGCREVLVGVARSRVRRFSTFGGSKFVAAATAAMRFLATAARELLSPKLIGFKVRSRGRYA